MATLVIPRRFNGPPQSGNGGWTAGALAQHLPGDDLGVTVTVRLHLPPPLMVPLTVDDPPGGAGPRVVLADDAGRTVAEAIVSETDLTPTPAVDVARAAAAEAGYPGRRRHPFPECFVCGPLRRPDDGLRLFPGPVPEVVGASGAPVVAAAWTPYQSDSPIAWAALDCPGGWSSDMLGRPSVLGTMTARIDRLPETADRYVVVGENRGTEGRKTFTAATLFGEDGTLVATAEHVWITVDPQRFG